MRIKLACLTFLFSALSATLVLAQEPLPSGALLSTGKLSMAADFAAAPNQFLTKDGKMDGLNYDLCGALSKKMGLEIDWTNLAFPGLVPGLQAQRFDGLCTAIFINPDRLKIMNMVPYVQWGEGLMVAKDSELGKCGFKSGDDASYGGCFDALAGKSVSVAASGTTNKHLKTESDRMVAKGLAAIDIRAFDSNSEAIQAVASGQTAAAYLNDPQAAFYINNTDKNFKLSFTGYASNQLALAVLKPNTALADALVKSLEAMKADGSYAKILSKWGVAEVPSFTYAK
jgi:polar amino acid transport system substrate-binding protein